MITWLLNKGDDQRLRGGHPWIFSNEIMTASKSLIPGTAVELKDAKGNFLAYGYGNANSQITFRAISTSLAEKDAVSPAGVLRRLIAAWECRDQWGYQGCFRLVFGEGDFLPGLVVDRYLRNDGSQVLAFQCLTAGMQMILNAAGIKIWQDLVELTISKGFSKISWEKTSVVQRNDVNIRKLEGLEIQAPQILAGLLSAEQLKQSVILMQTPNPDSYIELSCDLFEGQKTGFFLDQRRNIFDFLSFLRLQKPPEKVKILDLCCYVGHWSTQLSQFYKSIGVKDIEVHIVDISKEALAFAKLNAERAGATTVVVNEMDVVHDLPNLPSGNYDVVISDPPAFIKAKKDIPTGTHAYFKMNAEAFRVAKYRGYVVSCSCSGLLDDMSFKDVLRKSQIRSQRGSIRAILSGGHASDHPIRLSFPEGSYLKMWTHQI